MDKLESMRIYVHLVETQSFARTAEILGIPRSTVSRVIKTLERYLGMQLMQRTTRKLSVTIDGQHYAVECRRILNAIAALESSFPGRSGQPRGRLKVGMPRSLARVCFMPHIAQFLAQYPDLEVQLSADDQVTDVVGEGFDCVIRSGNIADSVTLVARPLARFPWVVLAAPAYIARYGLPETPGHLGNHRAVGYLDRHNGRPAEWIFEENGSEQVISMQSIFTVDDTDTYIQAGVQGIGLIRIAGYLAQQLIDDALMVPCLEHYGTRMSLSLIYPQSRYVSPAVRAFYHWSQSVLGATAVS